MSAGKGSRAESEKRMKGVKVLLRKATGTGSERQALHSRRWQACSKGVCRKMCSSGNRHGGMAWGGQLTPKVMIEESSASRCRIDLRV